MTSATVTYSTTPSNLHPQQHTIIRKIGGVSEVYCDGFETKRRADRIARALNSGENEALMIKMNGTQANSLIANTNAQL